jgi:hypothetical protein
MKLKRCAYCGASTAKLEKEHVFPKCLYPPSKSGSAIQRMTVPACARCNRGFSDDEAHFRNMLVVSGDPTPTVRELWETKVLPSLEQPDGVKRALDVLTHTRPVQTDEGHRHAVFPGEDDRVMRVLRKVIRGLCHYHRIMSPVSDRMVWTDVLKYRVPQEFRDRMLYDHREKDIVEYRYQVLDDPTIHSVWLITFFERCTFLGCVSTSEDLFPD